MQNFSSPMLRLFGQGSRVCLRLLHKEPNSIIVAAAARTPWGKCHGQLASVSALHLGQTVVEAAVKQSAIPLEHIETIFMNHIPKLQDNHNSEFVFKSFLKKAKYMSLFVGEEDAQMNSLLHAIEFVKNQQRAVAVAGGLVSATNNDFTKIAQQQMTKLNMNILNAAPSKIIDNYVAESVNRYTKSQAEAVFDSELVPLKVLKIQDKSRIIKEINHDEIFSEECREPHTTFKSCDGAAAVVLTTFSNALELNLSPLALITDVECLRSTSNILARNQKCVEKLLDKLKLDPQQIKHWEIEDSSPQLVYSLRQYFNLNLDLINPHGGSLILGHSPATSLIRLLTHIIHSLNPSEYGCVVCNTYEETMAFVVQKCSLTSAAGRLPLITLYTKDPCALCDILVEELELNFGGEYELEKVFIDTKDNIRFLRLYRNDIPVVFLNNQFLCMHRLNHRLLRKRLAINIL